MVGRIYVIVYYLFYFYSIKNFQLLARKIAKFSTKVERKSGKKLHYNQNVKKNLTVVITVIERLCIHVVPALAAHHECLWHLHTGNKFPKTSIKGNKTIPNCTFLFCIYKYCLILYN